MAGNSMPIDQSKKSNKRCITSLHCPRVREYYERMDKHYESITGSGNT